MVFYSAMCNNNRAKSIKYNDLSREVLKKCNVKVTQKIYNGLRLLYIVEFSTNATIEWESMSKLWVEGSTAATSSL